MMKVILISILFAGVACAAQSALPKATAYQVNLTWQAPTSSPDPVAGYLAFRGPTGSGVWGQLAAVGMALTYNDLTVVLGQNYDYMVESVDAGGVTSSPSNIATASIPGSDLSGGTISGKTT